jgi:hypothetical protein
LRCFTCASPFRDHRKRRQAGARRTRLHKAARSPARNCYSYPSQLSPIIGPPKPETELISFVEGQRPLAQTATPRCSNDPPTRRVIDLSADREIRLGSQAVSEVIHFLPLLLSEIEPALSTEWPEVHLVSWRQSARTTINQRRSKVIGGRFYDSGLIPLQQARIPQCPILARKWSASAASLHLISAIHQLTGECTG